MRRMTKFSQARDVGYIMPPMTVKPGKHVAAIVYDGTIREPQHPVSRGTINMSRPDKGSAFKIELKFGDPDLEQIVAIRAQEYEYQAERQRREIEKRKARVLAYRATLVLGA